MEKYLSDKSEKSLEELINYIKNTNEYKECIRLKQELNKDKELMDLIDEVRKLEKEYIRSGNDINKKEVLDKKTQLLKENYLYSNYLYYLDKVNDMIKIIKEELNDYFYKITNILN